MQHNLILVEVDPNYCDYLRKFDNKVQINNDGKEHRPYVGVLFEIQEMMYMAPLTSPKKKHLKMKDTIDFKKIEGGKYGAVNFNNMIPVTDKNITKIDVDKECYTKSEKLYMDLLKNQARWLNRKAEQILSQSRALYHNYLHNEMAPNVYKRCCNFKLLEEKCLEYNYGSKATQIMTLKEQIEAKKKELKIVNTEFKKNWQKAEKIEKNLKSLEANYENLSTEYDKLNRNYEQIQQELTRPENGKESLKNITKVDNSVAKED